MVRIADDNITVTSKKSFQKDLSFIPINFSGINTIVNQFRRVKKVKILKIYRGLVQPKSPNSSETCKPNCFSKQFTIHIFTMIFFGFKFSVISSCFYVTRRKSDKLNAHFTGTEV